ncbi:MAG: endonuclease/exonuclease/phosphatase [Chitinophagia bacterium]|jgi:hypothetical protein
MKKIIITINCFIFLNANAQSIIVGFYNCENFYDTTNQLHVVDEDFLPNSDKEYNSVAYESKSKHIASVLFQLGQLAKSNGLGLVGLAEIENKIVLNKLLDDPLIRKYHYKYIHFDSKDPRGVDVALIYNPIYFIPYQYKPITLTDATHFTSYATRDILYVKGLLNRSWIHILVNHWPSRRGGETNSISKRIWAATVCRRIIDSVQLADPAAKFLVMGDFNDNPDNQSLKSLQLINPFFPLYKKGIGSIAFRDSWNLFDQILLSPNWASSKSSEALPDSLAPPMPFNNLTTYKPIIYTNPDLIETQGKYRGYPKRTYDGDQFRGGYSDHFPVALIFKAKNAEKPLK